MDEQERLVAQIIGRDTNIGSDDAELIADSILAGEFDNIAAAIRAYYTN